MANSGRIAFISVFVAMFFTTISFGEAYRYESRGKRDPFVPLVGIDKPVISKLEDITSIADIRLEGIATGAKGKLVAVLNGEIVREGDKFGAIEILNITSKGVTMRIAGISYEKNIIEDGGTKSGR